MLTLNTVATVVTALAISATNKNNYTLPASRCQVTLGIFSLDQTAVRHKVHYDTALEGHNPRMAVVVCLSLVFTKYSR